jgi:hypothetical protein
MLSSTNTHLKAFEAKVGSQVLPCPRDLADALRHSHAQALAVRWLHP